MRRTVSLLALAVLGTRLLAQGLGSSDAVAPTFTKDVAPILYKHCVSCHRPGEIAPMSLLTYEQTRPYARAISNAVTKGTMPPWHADARAGTFHNERIITEADRRTIRDWAESGAPRGKAGDLPAPPVFTDGWGIGAPDVVFEPNLDYQVKATGKLDYEWFYIPTNFTEAKWVKAIEIRPGNRKAVHHALVYYRAVPDSPRALARPNAKNNILPKRTTPSNASYPRRTDMEDRPPRVVATYAPGTNPQVAPAGTAFRLEAGGILELNLHYTTTGEATTDRTRVGIVFSDDPSPRELYVQTFQNGVFTLPAGAANVAVTTDLEFLADANVWSVFPHTHVRGKRWHYQVTMPDGTENTILAVPRYDFNWQTYYMFSKPLRIPKGAKIVSTAWYDNSPANRSNPDPTVDVTWGSQTWEEMQYSSVLLTAP